MKRAHASPATLAAKRIKPNPEISAVAADSKKWRGGSQQRVTWSSQGDVPQVRVDLYKDNQLVEILAVRVANTNATTVKVPAGLTPGMYKVRVKSSSDSSVFAESASPVKIDSARSRLRSQPSLCSRTSFLLLPSRSTLARGSV